MAKYRNVLNSPELPAASYHPYSQWSRGSSVPSEGKYIELEGFCLHWWTYRMNAMWFPFSFFTEYRGLTPRLWVVNFEKLRMIAKEIRHVGRNGLCEHGPALMFRTRWVSPSAVFLGLEKVELELPNQWEKVSNTSICGKIYQVVYRISVEP